MPRKRARSKIRVNSPHSALKPSYSELAAECAALKNENAKLHKLIVKLEAQKISADNRIVALEEHFKDTEHQSTPSLSDIKNLDRLAEALAQSLLSRSGDIDPSADHKS